MRLSVKVETFEVAGRYQHKVYETGAKRTEEERREISEEVVNLLKQANEKAYREMPAGSEGLVSEISYLITSEWKKGVRQKILNGIAGV